MPVEKVVITRASKNDIADIMVLEREAFGRDAYPRGFLEEVLDREECIFLKASLKDKTVGYVLALRESNDEGHIISIAVKDSYKGKGIGGKLLEAAEQELAKRGAKIIRLEVSEKNTIARRLYERHGYKVIARLPSYYSDNSAALVMVKILEH